MFDKVQLMTNLIHNTVSGTIEDKQAFVEELLDHKLFNDPESMKILNQVHIRLELDTPKIDLLSIKQRLLLNNNQ